MLRRKYRKHITFSVLIKKKNLRIIKQLLEFIHGFRFMSNKLSDLVDNLSEIYIKECKGYQESRKIKSACNFIGLKKNKLNCEWKEYKVRWLKPINRLIKKFPNVYQFCNGDINKFVCC